MEAAFRAGDYERGAVTAIERIGHLISVHFPAFAGNPNELPDQPVLL